MLRALLVLVLLLVFAPSASAKTYPGFHAPGTPAKYNRVSTVVVGPASARNVLVLVPGTQAGAGYMLPFARDLVAARRGWQVWVVERRENQQEDQREQRAHHARALYARVSSGTFDRVSRRGGSPTTTVSSIRMPKRPSM